jgi:hypothetical protein
MSLRTMFPHVIASPFLYVIASPCPLAFAEALAQAGQGLAGGPIHQDVAISYVLFHPYQVMYNVNIEATEVQ